MEERIALGEDYSKVSSQRSQRGENRSARSSSAAHPAGLEAGQGQGLGPESADLQGQGLAGSEAATWGFAQGGGGGSQSPSSQSKTSRSSAGKSIHTTGGGAGDVKLSSVPHTPMVTSKKMIPHTRSMRCDYASPLSDYTPSL